eukprot:TRINITY_DN22932_c0_g1_i1.p1 TRINITY_DN22932_c0_g1~~TRINITY_DN22932_c0_g1_i1.p1  ORF type:complete len:100 (+),score=7.21 TRINITY_DN22932_c0_g1_i1:145-444(+)
MRLLDGMALKAPVVTLRFLKHLPKCTLPLSCLLVLLLDPKSYLHHATRNVPITPQRFDCLVIISRTRGFVEQWTPGVLILANLCLEKIDVAPARKPSTS